MIVLKHKVILFVATLLTALSVASPAALALTMPTSFAAAGCKAGEVAMESANKTVCCPKGTPTDNASACIINKYLTPGVQLLSALVGIAVTASIIIGAIMYSSSGGDPSKTAAAKERIRNSLIALIAFFFMMAFLQWLIPGGIV